MRHKAALAGVVASLVVGAWAAPPSPQTTKTTAHKKTTSVHHSARTTASSKATTAKTAPKNAVSASKAKSTTQKHPVVAHRYAAQQPTQERYKEIQQALATRGYFTAEPDGSWGPSSVDALKRFQHDQNLAEDGKIGSLALIALGLGPKRDAPEQPQKTVEQEQKIP